MSFIESQTSYRDNAISANSLDTWLFSKEKMSRLRAMSSKNYPIWYRVGDCTLPPCSYLYASQSIFCSSCPYLSLCLFMIVSICLCLSLSITADLCHSFFFISLLSLSVFSKIVGLELSLITVSVFSYVLPYISMSACLVSISIHFCFAFLCLSVFLPAILYVPGSSTIFILSCFSFVSLYWYLFFKMFVSILFLSFRFYTVSVWLFQDLCLSNYVFSSRCMSLNYLSQCLYLSFSLSTCIFISFLPLFLYI